MRDSEELALTPAPFTDGAPATHITPPPEPAHTDGVTDDLDLLVAVLPETFRNALALQPDDGLLLEIVLDLGRPATARYADREVVLGAGEVRAEDLQAVVRELGEFGGDNRAGIARTLHRISCIRNRRQDIVGLTMRVGRAVYGTVQVIEDLVHSGQSILLLGRPGVGKTTMLREIARVLSETGKRVIIVDTSNEIAGDGDIPHPGIGKARRMQVPTPAEQHAVMVEAVENHMPEVIIIDEIGTELEAQAARTIAERGVQLVATAHGNTLANLMMNPTLADLVGGIQTVTLSDEEARRRGTRKSVLERKAPPSFAVLVEIQSFHRVSIHSDIARTVDALLRGEAVEPKQREMDDEGEIHITNRPASGTVPPGERRSAGFSEPIELELERAPVRLQPTGPHRRIYPFGVSPARLGEAIRESGANASVVGGLEESDAMMTLRSIFRRRPGPVRDAEARGLPIFVLKHNTVVQMEQSLRALSQGQAEFDPVTSALAEAETAIQALNTGEELAVELAPQSAYIRRLQHQLAERFDLFSTSKGRDPERRVRVFRT
ncbi:MAG: Stage III sporulation protein SpoIIIAA [Chloroflexi bacterium]|nr:MAG: Stage III sporulation protein SpoIIIAA [Chloroflexota bacterium]